MKRILLLSALCAICFSISAQTVLTSGAVSCNPSGVACVNSTCTTPENVSDASATTAGTLTTALGVLCFNTLTANFASMQAANRWAGFYVQASDLLGLVTTMTLTIRNTSTLQSQSLAGVSLLTLLSGGRGYLQFQSSFAFNQIDITLGGVVGVDQSISIFAGYSSPGALSSPLPVTWLSFNATANANKIDLTWSTGSEVNSDKYIIERSIDGNNYNEIGVVKAAGNTPGYSDYSFTDAVPVSRTTNYYRIRQTDIDGRYTYSTVRYVEYKGETKQIQVFPNPASQFILVNGNLSQSRLRIFDLYGKEVLARTLSGNQQQIDIAHFTAGTYMVTIDANNTILGRQKLVVSKP